MSDSTPPTSPSTTAGTKTRPAPLLLLRRAEFRRVWLVGLLTGVMRWMDVLAVSVYVLQITGSPFFVALTLFVRIIPLFLFGAAVGAVAELVDRKKLLVFGMIFLACVYGGLAWIAITSRVEVWQLAIIVFFSGVFWTLELPIRRTMIAEIAGLEHLGAAMGLESSTTNFTRMMGPFVGGFLFELTGLPGTLMIGVISYLIAAIAIQAIRYAPAPTTGVYPSFVANLLEGLEYARTNRAIMATLAITIILNLFGFSFISMIPVIAKNVLNLSPFPTGILMSAEGFGALVGAILIAFHARPARFRQIFAAGGGIYLASVCLFATSSVFELSITLLWLGGFGVAGFASMQSALLIASAPPEMRNRIMGLLTMCIGVGPLGILIVGSLSEVLGAPTGILVTSSTGLVLMVIALICWPEMRKRQARLTHTMDRT